MSRQKGQRNKEELYIYTHTHSIQSSSGDNGARFGQIRDCCRVETLSSRLDSESVDTNDATLFETKTKRKRRTWRHVPREESGGAPLAESRKHTPTLRQLEGRRYRGPEISNTLIIRFRKLLSKSFRPFFSSSFLSSFLFFFFCSSSGLTTVGERRLLLL